MTSRDVRDIMQVSLPAPAGPSNSLQPLRRAGPDPQARQKRPDGITRELYALIGDNAPSLALASRVVKPKFKERVKRTGPGVKWQWTGFSNPSRSTGLKKGTEEEMEKERAAKGKLVLRHWVRDLPKGHIDGAPDEKFVKFNTSSLPFSYTPEEYTECLQEEGWTKGETDYLFSLAEEYDLRFVVISDRYEYSGSTRTVEDLKARYYNVGRKLLRHRPTTDEPARQAAISSLNFDKGRELERKAYLSSLLSRTAAQVAEEDFLYIESRRLEQSYHKITSERAQLLKILGGREGVGPQGGVQVGVGGGVKGMVGGAVGMNGGGAAAERKKKGQVGWDYEGLDGGGLPDGWAGEGSKRKATVAQDITNCIERHPAPSVSAVKAAPYPSVSVRSSRIIAPKATVQNKVRDMLVELSISTHLIMPTKTNVEKLDGLQAALGTLVDLKKAVDRIEGELRMYRARKGGLSNIAGEVEGETTAGAETAPEGEVTSEGPVKVDVDAASSGEMVVDSSVEADVDADADADVDADEDADAEVEKMMVVGDGAETSKTLDSDAATRVKRSASVTSSSGTATKRARKD